MEEKFVRPDARDTVWFNVSQVYKITKEGNQVTFHYVNGETFSMNSGHVPPDIKKVINGE